MEPIKLCEYPVFLYYQNFKVKCIARISLKNTIKHTILDETLIKPKDVLQDQHETKNQDNTTSNKRPRENQFNHKTLPKVKQVYK